MGNELRKFMQQILDYGEETGRFKVHFASAREVFNMIVTAVEGESGDPGQYRDYRFRQIWKEAESSGKGYGEESSAVGQS